MFVELTVENLAIIESARLELGPGFTVLTGETGAGKSLLVDAVELALGGRADPGAIRSGASRALVELAVDASARPELSACCAELGYETEDGMIVVQRVVHAEGKSQGRINGRLAPLAAIKRLGTLLADLHGQHDHQSLLDAARHLDYLDGWIGPPAEALRTEVAAEFESVQALRRRLIRARSGKQEAEHRADLLRYQVAEIDAAALQPGETEALAARLERLRHADLLSSAAQGALAGLADDEANAFDLASAAIGGLRAVARHDPALAPTLGELESGLVELQEATRALRAYAAGVEANPAELESLSARRDLLARLFNKYGADEPAVLAFADAARAELAELDDAGGEEGAIAARLESREAELDRLAARLTELRREAALRFAAEVQAELRELALAGAVFEVAWAGRPVGPTGADQVEFYFSANPGEPPRPLARVVSGGELSRAMLALKLVGAATTAVPTMVFDEIEAGLSGRAAAAVARKLAELARRAQVLVVSHMPQIASRADRHFRVEKSEADGRAVAVARELLPAEREAEIARMLAGEAVTETAMEHARALLSES